MAVISVNIDTSIDPKGDRPRDAGVLCPKGRHDVKFSNPVYQEAKPDKKAQIQVDYEVVGSKTNAAIGKAGKMWFSCSPKAVAYFLNPMIRASGIPYKPVTVRTPQGNVETLEFDTDHLDGAVLSGYCGHDTKGDRPRENWGDWEASELNPLLQFESASSIPQAAQQAAQRMPQPAGAAPPARRFPGR